jgi:endonuclease-3
MVIGSHYTTIMSKNIRPTFARLKSADVRAVKSGTKSSADSAQQKPAGAKSRQVPAAKKLRKPPPASGTKAAAKACRDADKPAASHAQRPAGVPPPQSWTPAEVREAFERFRKANPEPKGELEHLNPYTLLVAVVLSAQATDAGVNKATRALFAAADTPARMLALGEEKVRDYIKTIGLYRNKARNIIALSEKLIADFNGEVPCSRAGIESLPGAGRKTANVVLNMAFGEHTMAVDTHVFRVGNRTGMAPGKAPLEVELELERVIPDEFMLHAHHWLILHGRYTCLARSPRCTVCLINDLCRWPEKTI